MGDRLFLTLWLRGFSTLALPVYFRKLMAAFPMSRLAPSARFRIVPISFAEPAQLEEDFEADKGLEELSAIVQQHLHDDCAYQVETRWDLWHWEEGDWTLKPSQVVIDLYGASFESEFGEQIRIDFGPDTLFLPEPRSDQLRPVQSNIRSLLHLAGDLEQALPLERRTLWSEGDEHLADRLRALLD
jgi:hypothetical protein